MSRKKSLIARICKNPRRAAVIGVGICALAFCVAASQAHASESWYQMFGPPNGGPWRYLPHGKDWRGDLAMYAMNFGALLTVVGATSFGTWFTVSSLGVGMLLGWICGF